MHAPIRLTLFAILLLSSRASAWQDAEPAIPSEEDVQESVEKTRSLLKGGIIRPTRPWYDAKTDGVRRLDLRIERPAPNWNFNFSWLADLFKALGWLGLALFVLLLAFIIWRLIRYWRHRDAGENADTALTLDDRGSDVDRVEALPFRVARQATDLLSEARRQYEKGNYSEAIIYLFSHELVELDRQHLIHLARGKTNRQLVRELTARRDLRLLVEQTMVAFEDVFFGSHPLSRARFEACWFEVERFDRLVQEAVS
jgi:uncharacterized protein DUF4129